MTDQSEHLLLICEPSSYRISPFLKAAAKMGLQTTIASRGANSLISEIHDGLHVDLDHKASTVKLILKQNQVTPFCGVIGIDDGTVEVAAIVAQQLSFTHNPFTAAEFTRRKDLARAQLFKSDCQVPKHELINLDSTLPPKPKQVKFPCVIKPLAFSGSRGVIRANNPSEFVQACNRVKSLLHQSLTPFEQNHLLVEQYIHGDEVAFEGFLQNGVLNKIVIFDKPDPLVGPYFEETIYVEPSSLSASQQQLIFDQVDKACKAYGLVTGPIHAELRIDGDNAWILEVAGRTIGGDCARSLDDGGKFNLEELVISLAIDRNYSINIPDQARGVMMIPIKQHGILRRVEGLSDALEVENVTSVDIQARTGNELVPLPEGNQYPGYIFARADSSDQVITALRTAYEKLNFVVAPIFTTTVNS